MVQVYCWEWSVAFTLLDLNQGNEYSYEDEIRLRSLIFEIKAAINSQRQQSFQSLDQHSMVYQTEEESFSKSAYDNTRESTSGGLVVPQGEPSGSTVHSFAKFTHSKFSLPTFDGKPASWPVFCDTFIVLVDSGELVQCGKFYSLLWCLQADPLEVLKGITVFNDTYKVAWNALVERFDKPRKLASMLINQLMSALPNLSLLPKICRPWIPLLDYSMRMLLYLNCSTFRILAPFCYFVWHQGVYQRYLVVCLKLRTRMGIHSECSKICEDSYSGLGKYRGSRLLCF